MSEDFLIFDTKKNSKNREKIRKIIFGLKNNEVVFRLHQKMTKKSIKKIEKLFLDQNGLKQIMNQLLDYTKKLTKNRQNFWLRIDKKSSEKIEKLFLGQNFLKRIMSQLLDNTKKNKKSRKKNQKLIFGSELPEDFWIFDTKKWQKIEKKKSRKIDKNKGTKGEIRFLSYNNSPMQCHFHCFSRWLTVYFDLCFPTRTYFLNEIYCTYYRCTVYWW